MPVKNKWLLLLILMGLTLLFIIPVSVYAVDDSAPFVCAKNSKGELAIAGNNEILIFDADQNWTALALPELMDTELVRIITNINWNNNCDKLLYAALEDFPDIGSTFFILTALERNGTILGSVWIENLAAASWLKDGRILFLAYEHSADEDGKLYTWDYQSGEILAFLPEMEMICSHLAYCSESDLLAVVSETDQGDTLSLIDMNSGKINELLTLPDPVITLEWSQDGMLYVNKKQTVNQD
ncbi:MAG: hypothetical protein RBT41_04350 [Clostridia bacterium]|nr:hypothetical protein [Clostridia bacterium]